MIDGTSHPLKVPLDLRHAGREPALPYLQADRTLAVAEAGFGSCGAQRGRGGERRHAPRVAGHQGLAVPAEPVARMAQGDPPPRNGRSVKPSAQPTLVRTQHLPPPAKTARGLGFPWARGPSCVVSSCVILGQETSLYHGGYGHPQAPRSDGSDLRRQKQGHAPKPAARRQDPLVALCGGYSSGTPTNPACCR